MIPKRVIKRIIRDSVVLVFIVGVAASVFASHLYEAYKRGEYWYIATLSLGGLLLWAALSIAVLLREAGVGGKRREPAIDIVSGSGKKTLPDVLPLVKSEVGFMAIIGERSVKHDKFKEFVSRGAGGTMHVRLLLLDPETVIFSERAAEEREKAQLWRQDLDGTLQRVKHYREMYNANIDVRLYNVYPVWRIILIDDSKVLVNVFLPGKRGSESDQVVLSDVNSELSKAFKKYFDVVWEFHSRPAAI
jgi:hypothetical protein